MPETLLGSRVRLEYDDQNESFSRYLPVEGTISHLCVAARGPEDWLLVELDKPIDCQHEAGPHRESVRLIVPRILIRSRWADMPIGPGSTPSVFLLLVQQSQEVPAYGLITDDFIHICWARCHVLPATDQTR